MELAEFHFLRPQWLWALPPLALLLWRLARNGGGANVWRGIVDPHLLPHLLVAGGGGGSGPSRLLALLGLGWLLLVLALAGPSWSRLPQPVYQARQYRVLVLDISTSMNAPDVPPSRLVHARFEVLDLLERSGEGQTALIAYGAEPYVVSPLTGDADTIALQVPSLSSELLPVPGKRAGPAIAKAVELLRQAGAPGGEVILISDGLEDPDAALKAARDLRDAGHRLSILAVGTPRGAPIPDPKGGFLEDAAGAIHIPRLDSAALIELSHSGGGRYIQSRLDDRDLEALLSGSGLERLEQDESELAQSDQWREEGPWLLLLLLPLAALAFRRGWLSPLLLVLFIAPPQPAPALEWKDLWATPDQQGARALATDQPAEAAGLFADPRWRAAAHYRAGDYEAALEELQDRADSESDYNRGNALARLGRLEEAIQAYDRTLEQAPEHADARHNKELLEQLLQQQQQQEQEQRQQSDQQQESGDAEQQQSEQQQSGDSSQQQSGQQQESGAGEQQEQRSGDDQQQQGGESSEDSQQQQQAGEQEGDQQQGESERQQQIDKGKQADQTEQEATTNAPPEQPAEAAEAEKAAGEPREPDRSDLLNETEGEPAPAQAASATPEEGPVPESDQAMEQWLRRVPDDPAGLLRQRFLLQHLRNTGQLPRQ